MANVFLQRACVALALTLLAATPTPAPSSTNAVQRLSLADAIKIAVVKSPVFAGQLAQYRAVRAKYYAAKGALFPSVAINGTGKRTFGPVFTSGSNQNSGIVPTTGTSSTLGFNANVSQLIFDGGRAIAGIRSAKEGDISGYDTVARQLQTLAFTVAGVYYKALQAEQLTLLDVQIVRQYVRQEDLVRAQIRIGSAAPSDLAQAQFQTEQKQVALVQAQGAQIQAESAFATTLGLDANANVLPANNTPSNPTTSLLTTTVQSYDRAFQRAKLLRPDYLSAHHSVEASKENLRFTKLVRFPVLSAQANDGYNSTLINGSQLRESKSIGLTLAVPIFDQGLTNYNVAVAASQLDIAEAGLQSTKLTVESDVRSALAGYSSAVAAVTAAQAEVKSAQTAFNAANARYKIGSATLLDLITQQTNLSQAKNDLLTTVFNLRVAEQTYEYALGETKTNY